MNERVAVYTVLVKDDTELREPGFIHPDVDYICYSDKKDFDSSVWEHRPVVFFNNDPIRTARYYKLLPHRHLDDYSCSIYHDASFKLISDPLHLVSQYAKDAELVLHSHYLRSCIYDEVKTCIELYKDIRSTLREQERAYRALGAPEKMGLFETGVLIRRHTDSVKELGEKWWEQVVIHSTRDQISLPVVLQDTRVKVALFPAKDIRHSPDFHFIYPGLRPHPRYKIHSKISRYLEALKRKILSFLNSH